MTNEIEQPSRDSLLPDKHPQEDLFVCDISDAVIKDFHQEMEYPFYSLSKKPVTSIRRYQQGDNYLEITPSVKGLATIYDKDILIYAISQIMAKLNRNEEVSQRVRINCHEMLKFANRGTAGKDYKALCEAIDRLAGTRISTNIKTGNEETFENFGLIESGSIRRKNGMDGRIEWVELKISDWVFNAIRAKEVLTLHRDYFRLRKPIERRLYEVARKHCGRQPSWKISVEKLLAKTGSVGDIRNFRRTIKQICETDHLPDYSIKYDADTNQVTFTNREAWWDKTQRPEIPLLKDEQATLAKARMYADAETNPDTMMKEWVDFWIDTGCLPINDPDAAFLGYWRKRMETKRKETQPNLDGFEQNGSFLN